MAKVQTGSGGYARGGADAVGTRAGMADVVRQVLTVIGAVGQVVAGSFGFIFGLDVGQISDENGTLITPAGYAFAIWGPIFLLLLAYAVYQALPAQRTSPLLRRVGLPIALACLGDTVWEILFPIRQFVPAQLVIIGILASLLVAVWRSGGAPAGARPDRGGALAGGVAARPLRRLAHRRHPGRAGDHAADARCLADRGQ